VVEVPTYDQLATGSVRKNFGGSQTITWDPANTSGLHTDPIVMTAGEQLSPNAPSPPPDEVPGDVARYSVKVSDLTTASILTVAGEPTVTVNISTSASREELNARLFDVAPDGSQNLVTRGTYTFDTGNPALALGEQRVTIWTYGNLWQASTGHTLLLELTNVDSPYINPSKVPSATQLSGVELAIPSR
jgi:predicted acyl esterase